MNEPLLEEGVIVIRRFRACRVNDFTHLFWVSDPPVMHIPSFSAVRRYLPYSCGEAREKFESAFTALLTHICALGLCSSITVMLYVRLIRCLLRSLPSFQRRMLPVEWCYFTRWHPPVFLSVGCAQELAYLILCINGLDI